MTDDKKATADSNKTIVDESKSEQKKLPNTSATDLVIDNQKKN